MRSITLSIIICFLFINSISALDRKKDCKCRILPEKRIINGRVANHLAYPWQVNIGAKKLRNSSITDDPNSEKYKISHHNCGGSILNEWWILTAGHCIPRIIEEKRIGLGTNDLVKMFDEKMYIDIEDAIAHPLFKLDKSTITHDIGLIKLKTPINFTNIIGPACISTEEKIKYDGPLKVSGWGSVIIPTRTRDNQNRVDPLISRYLKEAINYDVTDKEILCQKGNAWEFICTENTKTNETSCQGDSGGPLHLTDKFGRSSVIGVVSHGSVVIENNYKAKTCTGKGSAYTRITSFIDFIEEHVGQNYCL